jgi:hypothetical protein
MAELATLQLQSSRMALTGDPVVVQLRLQIPVLELPDKVMTAVQLIPATHMMALAVVVVQEALVALAFITVKVVLPMEVMEVQV